MTMPEMTCEPVSQVVMTVDQKKWARVRELEWMIENLPATPAQREVWIEELTGLDEDLCWLAD